MVYSVRKTYITSFKVRGRFYLDHYFIGKLEILYVLQLKYCKMYHFADHLQIHYFSPNIENPMYFGKLNITKRIIPENMFRL